MTFRRLLWPILGAAALVVFLVAGVFPTRTYLHQREEIATAERKLSVLTKENEKLGNRVDQVESGTLPAGNAT